MLWLALVIAASLDGNASYAEGRKLYDQLEYEQAVFRFQQAALAPDLVGHDRATVFVWLGLSFAGAGDFDGAKRAFTDAARADTGIVLPVEVSAKLATLFSEAKAIAARDPPPQAAPRTAPAAGAPKDSPWIATVGAATGGVIVAAGAGAAILGAVSYGQATDRKAFASDAQRALDSANLELTAAAVLVPIGAVVTGVSAWFLLTEPSAP